MARTQTLTQTSVIARGVPLNIALAIAASIFVAISAHIAFPLPFSPVPFSMQNLAVLIVGLALGPEWGAGALALYLAEGVAGLPVFAPTGPGGLAQLVGATGGYLMAYPAVAYIAGLATSRLRGKLGRSSVGRFAAALFACTVAEVALFASGVSWLTLYTRSLPHAAMFGLLPFIPLEIAKIIIAAVAAPKLSRS